MKRNSINSSNRSKSNRGSKRKKVPQVQNNKQTTKILSKEIIKKSPARKESRNKKLVDYYIIPNKGLYVKKKESERKNKYRSRSKSKSKQSTSSKKKREKSAKKSENPEKTEKTKELKEDKSEERIAEELKKARKEKELALINKCINLEERTVTNININNRKGFGGFTGSSLREKFNSYVFPIIYKNSLGIKKNKHELLELRNKYNEKIYKLEKIEKEYKDGECIEVSLFGSYIG
jgi:hypothetical protein